MPQLFWNQETNPTPFIAQPPVESGGFNPAQPDPGEFAPLVVAEQVISKSVKDANRLLTSTIGMGQVNVQTDQPAWYDVFGRVAKAANGVNDALQSTMLKIIVLVAIVGVLAIFGMSYVQAKGANLAK